MVEPAVRVVIFFLAGFYYAIIQVFKNIFIEFFSRFDKPRKISWTRE